MANILPKAKQVLVLNLLSEGMSVRATERVADVSRETVLSLLVRAGEGCVKLHDRIMRDLPCTHLELDEQWGFVQKKQRWVTDRDDANEVGDTWLWIAICADTKCVPAFHIGKRTGVDAATFVADLSSWLRGRVQLSTDGLNAYVDSSERAFGADVDYAQVVGSFETEAIGPGRYSPPKVSAVEKHVVVGEPDVDRASTSYAERLNLTTRNGGAPYDAPHERAQQEDPQSPRGAGSARRQVKPRSPARDDPHVARDGGRVTSELWDMERLLDAALKEAA